jgi:hypothetical protein
MALPSPLSYLPGNATTPPDALYRSQGKAGSLHSLHCLQESTGSLGFLTRLQE